MKTHHSTIPKMGPVAKSLTSVHKTGMVAPKSGGGVLPPQQKAAP